jgi:hypothetical protein
MVREGLYWPTSEAFGKHQQKKDFAAKIWLI